MTSVFCQKEGWKHADSLTQLTELANKAGVKFKDIGSVDPSATDVDEFDHAPRVRISKAFI